MDRARIFFAATYPAETTDADLVQVFAGGSGDSVNTTGAKSIVHLLGQDAEA